MKTKRKSNLLIIILCFITCNVWGKTPGFSVSSRPIAPGGSCGRGDVIAGSYWFIRITNEADQPLKRLKEGWPQGYTLEASLDPIADQPFEPTPGLIEQLNPVWFFNNVNRSYESSLIKQDGSRVDARELNQKNLVLRIPFEFAGHTMCVRSRYQKNGENIVSTPSDVIRIVAPCSREDTARILSTEIYYSLESLEFFRGVTVADSMLQCGFSDEAAWYWAQKCAQGTGHPDRKLIYMEKMWQDFGTWMLGTDPQQRYSAEGQATYERKRAELGRVIEKMKKKKEQQK